MGNQLAAKRSTVNSRVKKEIIHGHNKSFYKFTTSHFDVVNSSEYPPCKVKRNLCSYDGGKQWPVVSIKPGILAVW